MLALAAVAATAATLHAAHQVADHWVQTQRQADHKGNPGWYGRWQCAAHVATYTATAVVALAALAAVTGWRPGLWPTVAGLTVSAVTHYVADRRAPLMRLAALMRKSRAWLERGGGMYALDQSWHVGWLWVSALVIAA